MEYKLDKEKKLEPLPPKPMTDAKKEQERINLIKRTVAAGTTNDEFLMFLYQAKRTGLDPLARQINVIKRGNKVNIQASIDGLRLVAQRSGEYAGQDAPIFDPANGIPEKCTITVYKFSPSGERYPAAVAVAYLSEYKPAPPNNFMWEKMPHAMLSKVAEALALRKAFPQDLSGIYGNEEMEAAVEQPKPPVKTTNNQPTIAPPAPKPETPVQTTSAVEPEIIEADLFVDQVVADGGEEVEMTPDALGEPVPMPKEEKRPGLSEVDAWKARIAKAKTVAEVEQIATDFQTSDLPKLADTMVAKALVERNEQLARQS